MVSLVALKSGDFPAIPAELNPEIHRILIHDGETQYAALLRLIADPANRPLVFHCSRGVHRTGTGAGRVPLDSTCRAAAISD